MHWLANGAAPLGVRCQYNIHWGSTLVCERVAITWYYFPPRVGGTRICLEVVTCQKLEASRHAHLWNGAGDLALAYKPRRRIEFDPCSRALRLFSSRLLYRTSRPTSIYEFGRPTVIILLFPTHLPFPSLATMKGLNLDTTYGASALSSFIAAAWALNFYLGLGSWGR